MFTLMNGLYQQYTQKQEFYIMMIGLDNAGKTTLLEKIKSVYNRSKGLSPGQIVPTVGMNMGKIEIGPSRLKFWDLGGQTELRSLWTRYYPEAHGIFFVVDSTDEARIQEVLGVVDAVMMQDELESIPMLMMANKQDDAAALPVHVIKEMLNPIAMKLNARESSVLAISALKGDGVEDAVQWMHNRLLRNCQYKPGVFSH